MGGAMTISRIVGYGMLPAVLLFTGWLVDRGQLWSSGANWTIPWLCSALALALLVVGAASLLCEQTPACLPRKAVVLLYLAIVLVMGAGIVVDGSDRPDQDAFRTSIAEWAGFSVILLVLFWVPRTRPLRGTPEATEPESRRASGAGQGTPAPPRA